MGRFCLTLFNFCVVISLTGACDVSNESAPSDILLTGVTQSSLKFTWKPPQDCQTQNGNITSYSYKLQNVDGKEVRNGTTEKTYVALGDLEPNRKYYFMVSAVNSEETGPYSEPVWEETRYRRPTCPGNSSLRFGGVLRSTAGTVGSRPWGTGQPIFILPHHLRKNPFKRGGAVLIVWFGTAKNCGGSSVPCPGRVTETQVSSACPIEEAPDDEFSQCNAPCPRYSDNTTKFSKESNSSSNLLLTWRDWDVTVDIGIGPITGYLLRHGKLGGSSTDIQKGLSLHHLFTDLIDKQWYSFEVIGMTGTSTVGGGLCDGSASFKVLHFAGCEEPSGKPRQPKRVYPRGTSQTSLQFRWCPAPPCSFGNYTLVSDNRIIKTEIICISKRYIVLNNLTACTEYEFQLQFVNTIGAGPKGFARGTTKCDTCPRYSDNTTKFSKESNSSSNLLLTWRDWDVTVDRGIGPITGYLLRHGKLGEPSTDIQKGLSLHHLFTDLIDKQWYSFEVIGMTGTSTVGGGLCDGSASFKVLHFAGCEALTGIPVDVDVSQVNSTSATVSWGKVTCVQSKNDNVIGYRYRLTSDGNGVREDTTKELKVELNSLTPNSKYKFKVKAMTSSKEGGPFTDDIVFDTPE
ncbi:receptor-type tyrosine-protein phosphatase delta-like isoform X2 [Apostichopus japonicus]|uniref:receptor-type tyrosine-protein phosphatase delta-like isoform X2 n=1 Tax=Stichopus japonicus TaxID=307972 RepID=UPI003AB1E3B5